MAYDAGMLSAVCGEINGAIAGAARVDKVLMPTPDEVVLQLHAARKTMRLSLNASGNAPRMTFTAETKENPLRPPMFCMLLRKHLTSATLTAVRQEGFERVARLCFSSRDEMGYAEDLYLIAEIMGKYSNLMLLDASDRILGALRVVDFSTSRLRQVLPGMTYELPPPQEKQDPRSVTREEFSRLLAEADADRPADKWITSVFLGTATQVAREIVWQASGRTDTAVGAISPARFAEAFVGRFERLTKGELHPTLVTDPDGAPIDYAYDEVHYFENAARTQSFATLGELFDAFYAARDRADHLRVLSSDISHLLRHEISRLSRKLEAQTTELAQAEKAADYRRLGDLVTANLYRIRRGDESAQCCDWEAEGQPTVSVPLDPRLSPSANAQRYYKLYNKGKNARTVLTQQMKAARAELDYLHSVSVFAEKAENAEELEGIRAELRREGYLKSTAKQPGKSKNPQAQKLRTFTSPGGYRVMAGTNNLQNEYLTFTLADRGDLWFHVKGMPGSHVVLFCGGEEPSEADYTFAAVVAAHYSAASGKGTAVDYTRVRELKRVPGGRPGFVVYHTNYSAYVDPADFEKLTGEKA